MTQVNPASFNEKWLANNEVFVNKTETSFVDIKSDPLKRGIKEKYLYYYSYSDIEKIVNLWKSKGLQVETNVQPINSEYSTIFYKIYSQNTNITNAKNIMITSLTHAREPASINIALAFIDDLYFGNDNINLISSNLKKILSKNYIYHICFVINPVGHKIDNSYVTKINGVLHNVPGIYYRKNGNSNIISPEYFKDLYKEVFDNFKLNPLNDSEIIIPDSDNYGVDLNRNCGIKSNNSSEMNYLWNFIYKNSNPTKKLNLFDKNFINLCNFYSITDRSEKNTLLNFINNSNKSIAKKLLSNGLFALDDEGSSPIENDETYRGTINSEKEIINFQKYFNSIDADAYISLHSYTNCLLVPTVFSATYPNPFFSNSIKNSYDNFINEVNKTIKSEYSENDIIKIISGDVSGITDKQQNPRADNIFYSTSANSIGYSTNGTMDEWAFLIKQKKYENMYKNGFTNKFKTITIEVGNTVFDKFYPNKYEMLDLVYIGVRSLSAFIGNI